MRKQRNQVTIEAVQSQTQMTTLSDNHVIVIITRKTSTVERSTQPIRVKRFTFAKKKSQRLKHRSET